MSDGIRIEMLFQPTAVDTELKKVEQKSKQKILLNVSLIKWAHCGPHGLMTSQVSIMTKPGGENIYSISD